MPGRITFTWTCDACGATDDGYIESYDIFDQIPLGTGLLPPEWEWRSRSVYCPKCRIVPVGTLVDVHPKSGPGYRGTITSVLITADETLYGIQREGDGTVNMVAAEYVERR